VRNLANGDVEIVAEGPRRELKILAAWAHQGPPLARVTGVEEEWSDYRGNERAFTIR
jgi:acylphosphatase